MTFQATPTFPHRHNRDGVIDSICSECFLTIASARVERHLARYERSHVCNPVRLYQLSTDPLRRSCLDRSQRANSLLAAVSIDQTASPASATLLLYPRGVR